MSCTATATARPESSRLAVATATGTVSGCTALRDRKDSHGLGELPESVVCGGLQERPTLLVQQSRRVVSEVEGIDPDQRVAGDVRVPVLDGLAETVVVLG